MLFDDDLTEALIGLALFAVAFAIVALCNRFDLVRTAAAQTVDPSPAPKSALRADVVDDEELSRASARLTQAYLSHWTGPTAAYSSGFQP